MEKANEMEEEKKQTKESHKKEKKPKDNEVIDELTETLQRLQAEFENYKKRTEKEKEEFVRYAKAELVAKLLPVLDTFEIALKSAKIGDTRKSKIFCVTEKQSFSRDFRDAENPKDFRANTNDKEKFVKGMEMVFAQLFSALEAEGLRLIQAQRKKFDPYYHEVMLKQESDEEEGIVLEELQKGYMFKDKVLRYSKVKVSEKKVEKNQTDEKNTAK